MPKKILYVEMDVHLLCIVIAVMDEKGKILSRAASSESLVCGISDGKVLMCREL